jgi:hypothetical protein
MRDTAQLREVGSLEESRVNVRTTVVPFAA